MHRLDCSCTPRHSQLWSHLRLGERGLASSSTPIVHLLSFIMFNKLFNNIVVRHGHSDCAEYIIANIKDGTAYVRYQNGNGYLYTNVSRRALLNLVINDNISLGRWINDCLLFVGSKCAKFGTCESVYEYTLAY